MKRREFSAAAACVLGAAALGLPGIALAQRKPEEGKDYRALDKVVAVEAPAGKIEVVEFFWYACPHCNAFEPKLVSWLKKAPQDVPAGKIEVIEFFWYSCPHCNAFEPQLSAWSKKLSLIHI